MPTTVAPDGPKFGKPETPRSDIIDKIHKDAPRSSSITAILISVVAVVFLIWTMFLATHYWHGMAPTSMFDGQRGVPYERIIANALVTIMLTVVVISIQLGQLAARREYIARELAKLV